jgi:hypothetical protein
MALLNISKYNVGGPSPFGSALEGMGQGLEEQKIRRERQRLLGLEAEDRRHALLTERDNVKMRLYQLARGAASEADFKMVDSLAKGLGDRFKSVGWNYDTKSLRDVWQKGPGYAAMKQAARDRILGIAQRDEEAQRVERETQQFEVDIENARLKQQALQLELDKARKQFTEGPQVSFKERNAFLSSATKTIESTADRYYPPNPMALEKRSPRAEEMIMIANQILTSMPHGQITAVDAANTAYSYLEGHINIQEINGELFFTQEEGQAGLGLNFGPAAAGGR